MQIYDVVIIGSGPSGLGLAEALEKKGLRNYVVLEREDHAGGIPYHCNHPTFGWLSKHHLMTGINFIKSMLKNIPEEKILTSTTVLSIKDKGIVEIHDKNGIREIQGRRVAVCTGNRERSRAARMLSGMRPLGIFTTCAIQQFVYLNKNMPFQHPLIVGSEHVSFSVLWTLKHAGVKPVAMIESADKIQTFWPLRYFGLFFGTNLHTGVSIKHINGIEKVESVDVVDKQGHVRNIKCDCIILTGDFVAENTLIREKGLRFAGPDNGPDVDKFHKTSDPYVYAAGNLIHPVDFGDRCYLEGKHLADVIIEDLKHNATPLPTGTVACELAGDIYHMQPCLFDERDPSSISVRLRVRKDIHGCIAIKQGSRTLKTMSGNFAAHRFYTTKLSKLEEGMPVEVSFNK